MNGRKKDYEYVKCTNCEKRYVNIIDGNSHYKGKPYCEKCLDDKKNKNFTKDTEYVLHLRKHVLNH